MNLVATNILCFITSKKSISAFILTELYVLLLRLFVLAPSFPTIRLYANPAIPEPSAKRVPKDGCKDTTKIAICNQSDFFLTNKMKFYLEKCCNSLYSGIYKELLWILGTNEKRVCLIIFDTPSPIKVGWAWILPPALGG